MTSENQAIKYIGNIFNIRPFMEGKFHRWGTACDYIIDKGIAVPEGLVDSTLITEPENILGSAWTLSRRSRIFKNASELFDENNQCYMLMCDASRSGAGSMFLLSCGLYEDAKEVRDDATYHIGAWSDYIGSSCGPNVISGGKVIDDKIFFIQALQLSSLMCKLTWEDNS